MLQLIDEEMETLESNLTEGGGGTQFTWHKTQHHLSLNSMKVSSRMGIIRFTRLDGDTDVQVLIDEGSSYTYLLQPYIT